MAAFNLNMVLGIGVFLVGVVYILYKRNMEEQVKEHINNVKNNIDISKITFMDEKENRSKCINYITSYRIIDRI